MESVPWIVILAFCEICLFIKRLKSIHVGTIKIELTAEDKAGAALPERMDREPTKQLKGRAR
jgi:hypothetical protein